MLIRKFSALVLPGDPKETPHTPPSASPPDTPSSQRGSPATRRACDLEESYDLDLNSGLSLDKQSVRLSGTVYALCLLLPGKADAGGITVANQLSIKQVEYPG